MPRRDTQPSLVNHTRFEIRPKRGLRRFDAALYVGVSQTKFDQLVADGRMPVPFRIDGCVLWDIRKLDHAIDQLSDEGPEPERDIVL